MQLATEYDVAIIGGGLAGLSCAIEMSKAGHSVVLFEKEKYPFHKVCGEYVSLESWNFLQQLGIPLKDMALPVIDTLFLSAPNGKFVNNKFPTGRIGNKPHPLQHSFVGLGKKNGVHVVEEAKVNEAFFDE